MSRLSFAKTQKPLSGIRCLLLDIYGTLFSSAAGEIGAGADYLYGDLDRLALEYTRGMNGEELKEYFRSSVREEHYRGIPGPPILKYG
ncbi:hypothetical protein MASR2M78_28630 [Treponema sp.]